MPLSGSVWGPGSSQTPPNQGGYALKGGFAPASKGGLHPLRAPNTAADTDCSLPNSTHTALRVGGAERHVLSRSLHEPVACAAYSNTIVVATQIDAAAGASVERDAPVARETASRRTSAARSARLSPERVSENSCISAGILVPIPMTYRKKLGDFSKGACGRDGGGLGSRFVPMTLKLVTPPLTDQTPPLLCYSKRTEI